MFFPGFSDVTNHVHMMKISEGSLFFSAIAICRPVTGAAWIGKKIFSNFCYEMFQVTHFWVNTITTLIPHRHHTDISIKKFLKSEFIPSTSMKRLNQNIGIFTMIWRLSNCSIFCLFKRLSTENLPIPKKFLNYHTLRFVSLP